MFDKEWITMQYVEYIWIYEKNYEDPRDMKARIINRPLAVKETQIM
jgi:hypothetical protein